MTPQRDTATYSGPSEDILAQQVHPQGVTGPPRLAEDNAPQLIELGFFNPGLVAQILEKEREATEASLELEAIPGFAEHFERVKIETGPGISWRSLKRE